MTRFLALIVAAIALAASPVSAAETLTGKVVSVADGDTLTLLVGKTQVKVRLEGIDAPERIQPFGTKAGQALSKEVFGKTVQVEDLGKDRYKRTLGVVRLGDRNVNLELVREGWAWWYRQYAPKNKELAAAEAEAREAKRGLWADREPVPPWEWRSRQREASQPKEGTGSYWLNTSSNVRHNSSCEWFGKTKRGRLCGPEEGKACGECGG